MHILQKTGKIKIASTKEAILLSTITFHFVSLKYNLPYPLSIVCIVTTQSLPVFKSNVLFVGESLCTDTCPDFVVPDPTGF